ncbi:MAG TPA: hypothetical protein VEV84_15260 [Pyrinomonadaceae bacterium]|jgi:outer membrane biosynthesis protein TonB|nr:hypothetical protein [Pyrinomonadaceae bacterium]
MELEFDKEIDALLRKAKRASPAAAQVASAGGSHLDADELVTFAENALPDRTRQLYIAHLADCDICRKMLSGFITTAPEQAAAAAAFAAAPAPTVATKIPWYRQLLAGANLAYTMAGLVILFSGFIGLLVYQNEQSRASREVSRVTESHPATTTANVSEAPQEYSNASTTNTASNSNTASPVESVTKTGVAVGSANTTTTTQEEPQPPPAKPDVAAGQPANEPAIAPAPSPQTEIKDQPATLAGRDAKPEKEKTEARADDATVNADEAKRRSEKDNRALREPAPSAKAAPLRAAGPRQQQMSVQNNTVTQGQTMDKELPVNGRAIGALPLTKTRSVGGKTFELRDGIWYDSAYHGGGTKDVKRGTDKYIRLDAGLRNIADSLGGTVLVVWDGKAYKIK